MSSVLETASTVSAIPATTSEQALVQQNAPYGSGDNRPRGKVQHGLEHIENIVHSYSNASRVPRVDIWKASDAELEDLIGFISRTTTPNARIFYNYERATRLLHIFLGPDDANLVPTQFEESLRSVFIDLTNLNHPRILTSQFDQIIYNDNARRWLGDNNIPWEQVEVQDAVDATLILRFNHGDVDFNATRRCMDAAQSVWNRKRSHLQLLKEVTAGQLNDLDPELVYSLALVHPDNENIVPMSEKYQRGTAVLVDVRRKYTMERVPFTKRDMPNITLPRVKTRRMESWGALLAALGEMDARIAETGKLESEGFVLRVYWDKECTVLRKILKMQTAVYQDLKRMRPNTGSRHEMILELFLKGNLAQYIKWANIDKSTKKLYYTAYMKFLEEVHACYHLTRGKKNPSIYNSLTGSWKARLFDIHGIYLDSRKKQAEDPEAQTVDITVAVVDQHLRSRPVQEIVHMISDRMGIVQNMRNLMFQRAVKNTHPFYKCREIEDISQEFRKEYEERSNHRVGGAPHRNRDSRDDADEGGDQDEGNATA